MTGPWSCLTYHAVPAGSPANHLDVPAATFVTQLEWLAANGYRGETMETAAETQSARVVAITFDDGDATQYDQAFPLLVAQGARATFFIVTAWVGRPGYVTWDQLREMRAAGMSIQSHSVSHRFFSLLPPVQLRQELLDSKRVLDEELGQSTGSIALPGGDEPSRGELPALTEAGYRWVATSRVGLNPVADTGTRARLVRRLTVRWGHPEDMFRRLVTQDRRTVRAASWRWQAVATVRRILGRRRYHQWRAAVATRLPAVVRRLGA